MRQRDALSMEEIQSAGEQILGRLLQMKEFTDAGQIFSYLSFRSEVPTYGIIEHCWAQNKAVAIPVCVQETKEMVLSYFDRSTKLEHVKFGLREPSIEALHFANREHVEVALIPGSAFDRKGYRIGYGAGYYDKFFAHTKKKILKIALAYSFQVIDEVPRNSYDVPMDFIVTEKEIIPCT